MISIVFAFYLVACVVCGLMGRRTTIGFMGHFLLAFFFSPLLDFVVLAIGRPNEVRVGDGSSSHWR
jgi:hypothetical protein